MKLKLTLLALSGLLVFAGCKKDKDDDATPSNPPQNTNTKELLVGKNWKLTGAKAFLGDSIDVYNNPLYATYVDCYKDDIITYSEQGTYALNDGDKTCSPALQTSGTWELSADQKTLFMDKGTESERTFNITSITSTTLIANTAFDTDFGPVQAKGTFTAQ
ncbi:hypothetical protein MYP_1086 [Sporocytophaga myxococcoides]|uniref:Lipocalin-like domain-containing protein n=1 Tax=Sporocytophaga myxococcoides TaxID=153721 RepID=A0A098LCN6_9BACT|nr:lipocalin family protein [Sporocytophaga myxococcoides]GAL83858.1 hypothetical protein MYP_1086 [Sporocytophaga myxococcoides]